MNVNPHLVSRLAKLCLTGTARGRGYTVPHVPTNAERLAAFRAQHSPEIGNAHRWPYLRREAQR